MKCAINGAGIAGPTLAFWLRKSGHEVCLIEQSPEPRHGGYIIDFWGAGYTIAEKMGLLPRILELGYKVDEVRLVDDAGRKVGGFDADVFARSTGGRFTSLLRSDLASAIYGALDDEVETIFGDSVAGLAEEDGCVRVAFEKAPTREFDLVIGADGLHSRVRELAFGAEQDFEVPLGYHIAAFEAEGYGPRDELVYLTHAVPGRQVSRFSMRDDRTLFLCVLRDDYLPSEKPSTDSGRKAIVREVFDGIGWEWPQISGEMEEAGDIYFDSVSQIRMNRWTTGRTTLIGDAAACVSLLAGEGTGLAMVEAYVLAGELSACEGDYITAFRRYEERLMPFLRRKQESAASFASSFVPRTALGIEFRNLVTRLFRIPLVAQYFIGRDLIDDISLPEYGPAGSNVQDSQ